MKIGAHIETSQGIKTIPGKAHRMGCECFQFFSRSPYGNPEKLLSEKSIESFKKECNKYNFKDYYIHAPYFVNLASCSPKILQDSIIVLKKELEVAEELGAKYLVVHLGSAGGADEDECINKVAESLEEIVGGKGGQCLFLIEIIAGAGKVIGKDFRQLGKIISKVSKSKQEAIGVCFDTCHVFVSGYDLSNKKAVSETLDNFEKEIGLDKLKLIHGNDAATDLGSNIDRHAHIGAGKIGREGFWALLHDERLKNLNIIIETPPNGIDDIEILKKLRNLDKI